MAKSKHQISVRNPLDENEVLVRTEGDEYKPELWELFKYLKFVTTIHPYCEPGLMMYKILSEDTSEDRLTNAYRFFPYVLSNIWEKHAGDNMTELQQENVKNIRLCLWGLSWGWYHYAHGPKPDQRRRPRVDVVIHTWESMLLCPYCLRTPVMDFELNKDRHGKQVYLDMGKEGKLSFFANWLKGHASQCQKPASKRILSKIKREEAKKALEGQHGGAYFQKLKSLGEEGKAVMSELQRLRAIEYKYERALETSGQVELDNQYYSDRLEEALRKQEELTLAMSSKKGPSGEDQAKYEIARSRIKEVRTTIYDVITGPFIDQARLREYQRLEQTYRRVIEQYEKKYGKPN